MPPPKRPKQRVTSDIRGSQVILLSCFEGIGIAAMVLQDLVGPLALHVSWECDPECLILLRRYFPSAHHRGDFMQDDVTEVAALIRQVDPGAEMTIVQAGAPPCPDFSRIKEDAPGKEGLEGSKFPKYCHFSKAIRDELPDHHFLQLCENVVLADQGEVAFFAQQLGVPAILVDASDFQAVSRPRLWWSSIDWSKARRSPITGEQLHWSRQNRLHRLHIDDHPTDLEHLETEGLQFHEKILNRKCVLPCFTTPSPAEAGRAAPRKMKGKVDPLVKSRWLADGRCYAPWQYAETALMESRDGSLSVPSARVKEQLHHIPRDWTLDEAIPDRSRHRMVANSWHAGVARFLLMLLLGLTTPTDGSPSPHCHAPRVSTLQWMAQQMSAMELSIGPGQWRGTPTCIPPAFGELHHWELSSSAIHPLQRPADLEPGLQQVVSFWLRWSHDLPRIRDEITAEVSIMVDDRGDQTVSWWKSLRPHVQQVYYNAEFDQVTQIPLFVELLRMFSFPEVDALAKELSSGFRVTGKLTPGPGWLPRTDSRYSYPISDATFKTINAAHTRSRLQHYRVDPHWKVMRDELLQELRLGRMEGPFIQPDWWPKKSITVEGFTLQPLEDQDIRAAFCFAVCQSDKVRRCEDYKRSGHNQRVETFDCPPHHGIQTYVELAKAFASHGHPCEACAQDLSSAYRQFPVDNPTECYSVLCCPQGPLLLRHRALAFGATSSVWSFNRAADAVTFLSRRMLQSLTGHYVDDFSACEPISTIDSGYRAFELVFQVLGLRMKPKKAQPPAATQKLLGVQLTLEPHRAVLSPHPDRLQKIVDIVDRSIHEDTMTPDLAQRLAGKILFLNTTLFGHIGQPALQPLYGRAYGTTSSNEVDNRLSHGLRSALRALRLWLDAPHPRIIPFSTSAPTAVVYTDAYFELGDRSYRIGTSDIPQRWRPMTCRC